MLLFLNLKQNWDYQCTNKYYCIKIIFDACKTGVLHV